MPLDLFQINAFSKDPFRGNPAAVCPLLQWLPTEVMQSIAFENALAETAFLVPSNGHYEIRWFTPEIEMDLCGHATLAAAYVLKHYLGYTNDRVKFSSSSGDLWVHMKEEALVMDFPSRPLVEADLPPVIAAGFDQQPIQILKSRDYILVYPDEKTIQDLQVDQGILNQINIDPGAIVVTAPGAKVDFVSRVFTPQASVFEDPVTGSTHCSLIPYWSQRLSKKALSARQLSKRTGALFCEDRGDRVYIGGFCNPFLVGKIYL